MHFGENQLSPSSIGISPLLTVHPPLLQQWWVRASTKFYLRFTLTISSSLGFGSTSCHLAPCSDSLSLWLRLYWLNRATEGNSPVRSTKSTPSPIPQSGIGLRPLCKRRVSRLFHPPCGALFTFPSRYLFTIGHRGYLALGSGLPIFPANSTWWLVLRCTTAGCNLSATGLSPAMAHRPRCFA